MNNINTLSADWFRTYHAIPGVFAGEGEVKAALDAYPGNRTIGDDVQAFADHGGITARVRSGIEGTAPDMPEIDDLIDREPETAEELSAWLVGYLDGVI